MVSERKLIRVELLCSCMQPPAFPRHLKTASPKLDNFLFEVYNFLILLVRIFNFFDFVHTDPSGHGVHTPESLSGPCSIEMYVSSQMANRYTSIFDAG